MKLKNIFSTILIGALAFVGCTEGYETTSLEEIQLSKTFVSIPVEGGEVSIDMTANADWSFDKIFEVKSKDANGETVYEYFETPSWLTVTPLSGNAGDYKLSFSADATDSGRETGLVISIAGKKQNITVRQGEVAASKATCKEVIDGPDGKSYIVTGVVTSIANTTYGNWYLKDDTGEIYIYGTLDSEGKTKNFTSLNIEVGDEVTVKGPKTTYGTTVELVDVKVVELKKAILKGLTPDIEVPKEGGNVEAKFIVKGDGPTFKMPEDVRSWASVVDFSTLKSQDIDDPDTTVVKIFVEPNELGSRKGSITFNSKSKDGSTDAVVTLVQAGSAEKMTVAELTAVVNKGDVIYNAILTDAVVSYVNGSNAFIEDATGGILLYSRDHGLKAGQKISGIVSGSAKVYENLPELTSMDYSGATVTEGATIPCTELTIAELLADYTRYISCRVLIKGVKVADGINLADDRDGVIAQGENKVNLRSQDKNTVVVEADKVGDLICYPTIYKENKQVGIWQNSDFTVTDGGEDVPAVSIEGKQWLGEYEGMELLVDLGASEEGMAMIALPSEDGSGFFLYAAGPYVVNDTDATSGTIVCELIDFEVEMTSTESFSYSDLTEASVNITSKDFFGVATPLAFTKVSKYIEITLPGEDGGGDVTENSIESGKYWIVNSELQKVAVPVDEGKDYDYLMVEDMTGGASTAKNAFTFTYNADETRYTIQDSYGRYLYCKGTFNSFNVSAELPETGAYWSIEARGDGTYDIYNGENGFSISYSTSYNNFEARHPDNEKFSGVYPTLIKAE